jgi:siroheme synthase
VPGHNETGYGPILASLTPNSLTVVVLMGLATRAAIASFLLARGWRATTPAAVLLAASTPASTAWTGTLESLSQAPETHSEDPSRSQRDRDKIGATEFISGGPEAAPGTLVIGEVVDVAAQLGLIHSSEAGGLYVGRR